MKNKGEKVFTIVKGAFTEATEATEALPKGSNAGKQSKRRWLKKGIVATCLLAGSFMMASAKTLVFCSEASPEGFNPQLVSASNSIDASAVPLYNRLVEFKLGTTEIRPGLAEHWEISEDGKTYTFFLRKGVKWHSNRYFTPSRELNADDVLFSFKRQWDKTHPYHTISPLPFTYFESLGLSELIENIEKADDYTVIFTLKQPDASFLANVGLAFSSILSAEYAEAMLAAGTPERVDRDPIGTGPFELKQYQADSRILFTRFEDHFGEKAKLKRLIFSITPDPSVRYAKLQKGDCHVMAFPNLNDLSRIKEDPKLKVVEKPGMNIGFVAYNLDKAPLNNLKVRQALNMAVNKSDIIEAVFQGGAEPAVSFLPPTIWGYNGDLPEYEYNPEQAKALLKEAGFEEGFTLDLWAIPVQRPYNPNGRRMAELLQDDWAKIGVNTNVVSYEWGEYLNRMRKGEHDIAMMGWTGANGDPDNFLGVLMSCRAKAAGSNNSNWCNAEFDALVNAALIEQDQSKRAKLYQEAQAIMQAEAPTLNIAHSIVYVPMRKEVQNYVIDPLGPHNFNYVDLEE